MTAAEVRQAAEAEADPPPQPQALLGHLTAYSNIIAPTTLVTSLLFYFGYLATRARFEYFGVYLDLVNLSTADLLLYGSEVVYVPIVLVALIALATAGLGLGTQWLVSDPRRDALSRWTALAIVMISFILFVRAVVGIVVPHVSANEVQGTTALSLTIGVLLLRHAGTLWGKLRERRSDPGWAPSGSGLAIARWSSIALAVCGVFWAANSFAASYGAGLGQVDAERLGGRPQVFLQTAEPLADPPPGVSHTALPAGGKFKHRYTGLRLLVESGGHLFLVPAPWQRGVSRTVVLANSGDVRLQLK
ncbi:hypothetical protein [Nonomuraea africana]|uniref:DUF5671 domain-containing protein n=1 Tax=Nonomuraea africana TaxID=46171 RepID=A0ABR9KPJ1_9ACTN|nr:hypothetical protein [Nonomuraea africana]MBE1563947.1 hypothetical protein [Nonomuraea africana]